MCVLGLAITGRMSATEQFKNSAKDSPISERTGIAVGAQPLESVSPRKNTTRVGFRSVGPFRATSGYSTLSPDKCAINQYLPAGWIEKCAATEEELRRLNLSPLIFHSARN